MPKESSSKGLGRRSNSSTCVQKFRKKEGLRLVDKRESKQEKDRPTKTHRQEESSSQEGRFVEQFQPRHSTEQEELQAEEPDHSQE